MGEKDRYKMTKTEKIITVIFCILTVIVFIWSQQHTREIEDKIRRNGIETIGIVTGKAATWPGGHRQRNVYFEFEHNGRTFRNSAARPSLTRCQFDRAIIGERYKVMFLPCSPRNAIIFLDKPITD